MDAPFETPLRLTGDSIVDATGRELDDSDTPALIAAVNAYADLVRERDRLREALADVFALIDEGWLVRNIQGDIATNWAINAAPNVLRLAKAREIAKEAGRG